MADSIDKIQLRDRTRARHQSLWVRGSFGGIMAPIAAQQDALNLLAGAGVENSMAISDETWAIKEYERDKTNELDQFGVAQDRQIADEKAVLERTKLSIKKATDAYVLAVMQYETAVKNLIMAAREYAAQVELEQLEVERLRSILAVEKEGLHLKQVNAQIYYEVIAKAMVEADLAKAQVDVAKATVRAVMADIEAGEAEIKLIMAQVEQAMTEADKAGIRRGRSGNLHVTDAEAIARRACRAAATA